jgi:hypothetical protein
MARVIPVEFDLLWNNYLKRPLVGDFEAHMAGLERARQQWIKANPGKPEPPKNTPCVIQLCHALNAAGIVIPPHSFWRSNPRINGRYFLSAVNELETYLTQRFFPGTAVAGSTSGQTQSDLQGKRGILAFGAFHCESWKDDRVLQRDRIPLPSGGFVDGMSGEIWSAKRIIFWEVKGSGAFAALPQLPAAMLGWWKVTDPNVYYYYFGADNVVFDTKTAPKKLTEVAEKTGINDGKVLPLPTAPFSFRIDWNPADGGTTVETFSEVPSGSTPMLQGTSNRYGNLSATKLGK